MEADEIVVPLSIVEASSTRDMDVYKYIVSHDIFTLHPIFILFCSLYHSLQFCELVILYTY